MTDTQWTDFHGTPLAIGDRIIPIGIDSGVPAWLANTRATIVGFGRTRIYVRFDSEAYGGKWPEMRAIGMYVRKVDDAR